MKTLHPRSGYDLYCDFYRKDHIWLDSFDKKDFLEFVHTSNSILDLGVGDGRLKSELYKRSELVIGVDLSIKMLKRSKLLLLIQSDAQILPFKNCSFSSVIASFLLVHIENPMILFNEVFRILKKEGNFIFNIISQKSSPILNLKNKKLRIISYYHPPEKIELMLDKTSFFFKKRIIANENGQWISQIYKAFK